MILVKEYDESGKYKWFEWVLTYDIAYYYSMGRNLIDVDLTFEIIEVIVDDNGRLIEHIIFSSRKCNNKIDEKEFECLKE